MPPVNGHNGDIKDLLAEWKLESIMSHLSVEQIDVEILEMMKISHIRLLLYNFPLGIQIRFEYNLEQWRRSIGKPLPASHLYDERNPIMIREQEDTAKTKSIDVIKSKPRLETKNTQTDLTILDTNSSANTEKMDDSSTPSQKVTTSNISASTSTSNVTGVQNVIKTRVSIPPPPLPVAQEVTPAKISTASTNPYAIPKGPLPKVDLKHILTVVPYGVELANKYRERKCFSVSERRQLLSVIVNYYLDNNLKFNLLTSYALEQAILQMFPNEKLEMYRTAKRGRLYSRYLGGKAAIRYARMDQNENSDMDYGGSTADGCFSFDNFSDDSQMVQARHTADSMVSNMSHLEDYDDCDDAIMGEDEFTVDFVGEDDAAAAATAAEDTKVQPEIKIEAEHVAETPPRLPPMVLSAEFLFKKRKPEDDDMPFENFEVPWHKVPTDVLGMLERQEKLGKRLNTLANLFVDELRNISTHVPMRVFRNVTQQVVTKYPYSFLDKDSEGNIIASATIPLLQRMRNRNNFLNR